MELIEGETLMARLAKGPMALDQLLPIGMQIADALDKAHRQGIVHRDLKPGNVMLTKGGAKLLDFGLAKVLAPAAHTSGATSLPTMAPQQNLTQQGTILGTFQYMAPEQLEGGEADARSDIFSFGAVLYEMATGKKAFDGKSQASLIGSILRGQPAARLVDRADDAAGPRPPDRDLPLEGPGGPPPDGARREAPTPVGRRGRLAGRTSGARGRPAQEPREARVDARGRGRGRRARLRGRILPARSARSLADLRRDPASREGRSSSRLRSLPTGERWRSPRGERVCNPASGSGTSAPPRRTR